MWYFCRSSGRLIEPDIGEDAGGIERIHPHGAGELMVSSSAVASVMSNRMVRGRGGGVVDSNVGDTRGRLPGSQEELVNHSVLATTLVHRRHEFHYPAPNGWSGRSLNAGTAATRSATPHSWISSSAAPGCWGNS